MVDAKKKKKKFCRDASNVYIAFLAGLNSRQESTRLCLANSFVNVNLKGLANGERADLSRNGKKNGLSSYFLEGNHLQEM